MKTKKILILHGPNMNLIGERDRETYGTSTLAELNRNLRSYARELGCWVKIQQFNSEGALIDALHSHRRSVVGVVFNPGAYTHYSYALRDAVAAIAVPTIEVHLSDISRREPFRRISVIAPACREQISGLGQGSYLRAMKSLVGGEVSREMSQEMKRKIRKKTNRKKN